MRNFRGPHADLTKTIIGAAIRAHKILGPGLLESTYQKCLAFEIGTAGLSVETEIPLAIDYPGLILPACYKIDLLVEKAVIVEVKSVAILNPLYSAQIRTYLRHAGLETGLLINFNCKILKEGIQRISSSPLSPAPLSQ